MNYLSELKRRNIFKVSVAYLVLSWVILQIVDVITPVLFLPESLARIVFVMLAILFPITLIIAWAFELTPEGFKKTDDVVRSESIRATTGQKINYIIIGLLAIAVVFLVYDRGSTPDAELRENTIAVMPFTDMSPDGSQEYFGDGMAEEILNVLVSIDALDVASRTSSFSLKNEDLLITEIAERLQVNYVIEGSIRSDGNNVRVTAQLIDVEANAHLWSETYDRELTSIFAIQDEISIAIADALKVELLGDVIGDVPTQNMEAYALLLKAWQLSYLPNFEKYIEIKDLANQAVILDPTFADGWALLSHSYHILAIFGRYSYSPEELENLKLMALKAANKAISLNPILVAGWVSKGRIHLMALDWMEAIIALDQALENDPKSESTQYFLALYSHAVGNFETSIDAFNTIISNNPDGADSHTRLAINLIANGKIEQAQALIEKVIAMGYGWANYNRAILLMMEGNKDNVVENFRTAHAHLGWSAIENLDLFVDGYFDPSLREDYKKLIPDPTVSNNFKPLLASLLLHDGDKFVQSVKIEPVFKAEILEFIYLPPYRSMLNQQVVKNYLKEIGLLELWQQTKFPHFCRAVGTDDFECDRD